MGFKSSILLALFSLLVPSAYAADGDPAPEGEGKKEAAEAPASNDAPAPAEGEGKKVLDLNEVDLEQVEEDWDSAPKQQAVESDNRLKINDIVQPKADYSYASFGKADPFEMPSTRGFESPEAGGTEVSLMTPEGKEIKISNPLQGYPLNELKVKGIWQLENGEMRSMIVTPRNEGVVAKVDDPISSGKIIAIARDALTVRLYKIRKDGVREYEDQRVQFGAVNRVTKGVIKLEPGKDAQFLTPDNEKAGPQASLDSAIPAAPAAAMPGAPAAAAPGALGAAPGGAAGAKPAVPGAPGAAAGAANPAAAAANPAAAAAPGIVPANNPTAPKTSRPGT